VSAFAFVYVYGPALAGLVLTLLLRTFSRRGGRWAALAGLVIAAGFVLRYYPASTSGDDWGPSLVIYIAAQAYVFWLLGVAVGVGLAVGCGVEIGVGEAVIDGDAAGASVTVTFG